MHRVKTQSIGNEQTAVSLLCWVEQCYTSSLFCQKVYNSHAENQELDESNFRLSPKLGLTLYKSYDTQVAQGRHKRFSIWAECS